MSKTKNVVDAAAYKRVYAEGKFVSQHKEEDIKKFLDFMSADRSVRGYGNVFSIEDYDWEDDGVENINLYFREEIGRAHV